MMQRDDDAFLTALIQAVSNGDHQALARLYDRTSSTLYAVLLRMLRDPELAREALQDCYIRVWQRAETFDPARGEPIAWLIGNARYRALDILRQAGHRSQEISDDHLAEMPDPEPGPEQESEELDGLQRLMRCMDDLSEVQRKSVLLAYYKGYSHQELSEAMDAPLGTVKAWLRRGLAKLRSCLSRQSSSGTES